MRWEAKWTMKALSVLVVEDDSIVGMLLAELLEVMGYDVCAIEVTEADAVAAAIRCRPDLMIVDVQLSNGSGLSAVEEILRTRTIPYVIVSGDISEVQALRPGAVLMQKPYRESDIVQAIQSARGAGT
jgi:two-component system, response regulator PdtaR